MKIELPTEIVMERDTSALRAAVHRALVASCDNLAIQVEAP